MTICAKFAFSDECLECVELLPDGEGALFVSATKQQEMRVTEWLEALERGIELPFPFPLKWEGVTGFTREVLTAISEIPYGEVKSYGEIAREVGRPKGARAVGMACNRNRFPLVIPCHRVIAAGGKIGGFGYGLEMKKRLLDCEYFFLNDRRSSVPGA